MSILHEFAIDSWIFGELGPHFVHSVVHFKRVVGHLVWRDAYQWPLKQCQ